MFVKDDVSEDIRKQIELLGSQEPRCYASKIILNGWGLGEKS